MTRCGRTVATLREIAAGPERRAHFRRQWSRCILPLGHFGPHAAHSPGFRETTGAAGYSIRPPIHGSRGQHSRDSQPVKAVCCPCPCNDTPPGFCGGCGGVNIARR